MDVTITLTVNGTERIVTTDPQRPLLDVLREDLHLTGTKYGCGEGYSMSTAEFFIFCRVDPADLFFR